MNLKRTLVIFLAIVMVIGFSPAPSPYAAAVEDELPLVPAGPRPTTPPEQIEAPQLEVENIASTERFSLTGTMWKMPHPMTFTSPRMVRAGAN